MYVLPACSVIVDMFCLLFISCMYILCFIFYTVYDYVTENMDAVSRDLAEATAALIDGFENLFGVIESAACRTCGQVCNRARCTRACMQDLYAALLMDIYDLRICV